MIHEKVVMAHTHTHTHTHRLYKSVSVPPGNKDLWLSTPWLVTFKLFCISYIHEDEPRTKPFNTSAPRLVEFGDLLAFLSCPCEVKHVSAYGIKCMVHAC
jgi:hypothetical protein